MVEFAESPVPEQGSLSEGELQSEFPCAICVVETDKLFTLRWANKAFYELMDCTEEEMGIRYAHRLSALWDKDAIDHLSLIRQTGTPGEGTRFLHHVATHGNERVIGTDAALVGADEGMVLVCVSVDRTREAHLDAQLVQLRSMGSCVAETVGFELFAYDASRRTARVVVASSVLGQLPGEQSVCPNFSETVLREGLVHPDDEETFLQAFLGRVFDGAHYTCDVRLGGPAPETGRWHWYRLTLVGCANSLLPGGASGGGVLMDITEHKELMMAYLNETQFYHALLADMDAYAQVDVTDDAILKVGGMWNLYNELIEETSYSEVFDSFVGKVVHPDDRARYSALMQRQNYIESLESGIDRLGCEFRRIVEQNKMAWMSLTVHLLKDPVTHHVLALLGIKNIDKKKRQELHLQKMAELDPLTHVLHKKAAEGAIRARLRAASVGNTNALMILDIDDFKGINDHCGHQSGDDVLVRFASAIRSVVGWDDVVGRFGGDEFVVFLANAFDRQHVATLFDRLFQLLETDTGSSFSCSAGVALMQGDIGYDEAFRRADASLYAAKARGKAAYAFYHELSDKEIQSAPAVQQATLLDQSMRIAKASLSAAGGESSAESDALSRGVHRHETLDGMADSADGSFASFLSEQADMAYLVDPDTYELICGNLAFYHRIGETPASCLGMRCYEAMHRRSAPCPFCSKANWSTDKFFMWKNVNDALDQEFLIKNKLVMWQGREALLAVAVDISNNKSIVDSLDNGTAEGHHLLGGIQQMNAAEDLDDVIDRALEAIGRFFRAERVCFWASEGGQTPYKCIVAWSDKSGAVLPIVPRDHSLDAWLSVQQWDAPVMVESPEAVMRSSYAMYRFMKENEIANARWVEVRGDAKDNRPPEYLSVENLHINLENVAFLEQFTVFFASEVRKRRMMAELVRASSHDELTGLLNRESYERRIAAFDGDQVRSVGVVTANVNNMKHINSTKGFSAGNYYLRQFASMLEDAFPVDGVYRLNGDEFAVIAIDMAREDLERRIRDVRTAIEANGLFAVALSYSWDDVEKNLSELTEQALTAMEADKKRFHDLAGDGSRGEDRRLTLRSIVRAIEDGRFFIYLQPKVELETGRLAGAEALIRYRDDELGLVPPVRFIQQLEDNGFIRHIDLFVVEQVCQLLARWQSKGIFVPVSLNLSRRSVLESDILKNIEAIASRFNIDRGCLEIEITESFAALGKGVLYQTATELLQAGFLLSLDDFGTKYTNLSILAGLDFNMIKLDKSLIEEIVDADTQQIVVKHVVNMCNELHIDVVAEGVETVAQEQVLKTLGCHLGQGYLYSRPIPVEDFEQAFLPS